MKNFIKFALILGIFSAVYFVGEQLMSVLIPNHETISNTSLLFLYGGITGYVLFIVFVVLLQEEGFQKIKNYKPRLSKTLHQLYVFVAAVFILIAFINFELQLLILLALVFMLITASLDSIRDKIIQEKEGNLLHPKKII
ncbi:MAG: hypothetical protein NUK62_07465 [Tenericutes bacterium]|nr:hypothetical protein [Mycoplasmatota bacterium]